MTTASSCSPSFCALIRTPERTVREWRRCGRGPTWHRFNGNGALYVTVAELLPIPEGRHQLCPPHAGPPRLTNGNG